MIPIETGALALCIYFGLLIFLHMRHQQSLRETRKMTDEYMQKCKSKMDAELVLAFKAGAEYMLENLKTIGLVDPNLQCTVEQVTRKTAAESDEEFLKSLKIKP